MGRKSPSIRKHQKGGIIMKTMLWLLVVGVVMMLLLYILADITLQHFFLTIAKGR